ncbi:hypothetical protein E2562_000342, partial [Oryza meyeriana var. granulata]
RRRGKKMLEVKGKARKGHTWDKKVETDLKTSMEWQNIFDRNLPSRSDGNAQVPNW